MKFNTSLLHGAFRGEPQTGATLTPIYQSSAFEQESAERLEKIFHNQAPGFSYTRINNPTVEAFEKRMTVLEGGKSSVACASGMAAMFNAFANILQAGDEIVSSASLYGGSIDLFRDLEAFGITTHYVENNDLDAFCKVTNAHTRLYFAETLGNPRLDVTDIKVLAKLAHENGVPLIIDNTFGTPYLIRPIEHGADIVVHSATKFIGGHGTSLGGIIVDSGKFDWTASGKFPQLSDPDPSYHGIRFTQAAGAAAYVTRIRAVILRDTGAAISPFNAFLLLQGLETLSLRVERHVENALKVVDFLSRHPKVKRVNHPALPDHPDHALYERYFPQGAGSIFTFEIKGGTEEAHRFIDNLKIFSLLANVADVKSLVIHPASTTHSQLTDQEKEEQEIFPGTVRLSIGTEHIDDLIDDLKQALEKV